jgi:hypothetical protein
MRRLLVLLALLTLGALAASTAAATTHEVVQRNVTVKRLFTGLTDCQAFGYDFTFTGQYTVKRSNVLYYDESGNLIKEVIWAHFVGTDTNDSTGKSLRDTGQRHITFDYVNNTITESGVLRHITVPGSGIVLHESGRVIVSLTDESVIFMAGPHQLFEGDLAEFCAALADP